MALVNDPPGVTTTTLCVPAVPVDVTAVICVAVATRPVTALPPTLTLLAPAKFVPLIVMAVPPATGPDTGVTDVMVGVGSL